MKFRSMFIRGNESYKAPTGDKIEVRHSAHMHDNGRRELVPDKKVAIYDLIQENKEDCEIENIIRRAVEGDPLILNKMAGTYTDVTGAPKSIAEAQQLMHNMRTEFDKLPADVRSKFENNVEIYIAEYGSQTWLDKTGLKAKAIELSKAKEETSKLNEKAMKAIISIADGAKINSHEEVENNAE